MSEDDKLRAITDELREAQVLIDLLYIHLLSDLDGPARDSIFESLEIKAQNMLGEGRNPAMLMSFMTRLRGLGFPT